MTHKNTKAFNFVITLLVLSNKKTAMTIYTSLVTLSVELPYPVLTIVRLGVFLIKI